MLTQFWLDLANSHCEILLRGHILKRMFELVWSGWDRMTYCMMYWWLGTYFTVFLVVVKDDKLEIGGFINRSTN